MENKTSTNHENGNGANGEGAKNRLTVKGSCFLHLLAGMWDFSK